MVIYLVLICIKSGLNCANAVLNYTKSWLMAINLHQLNTCLGKIHFKLPKWATSMPSKPSCFGAIKS